MIKGKGPVRFFILTAIFVVPLFFFSSSIRPWKINSDHLLMRLQELVYPFELSLMNGSKALENIWNQYIALHKTSLENLSLKRENQSLRQKLLSYENYSDELKRLRKLFRFSDELNMHETVAAEVVSYHSQSGFSSLRVAKGQNDEIKIGMPVIASAGIVGRVLRLGRNFSDIQELSDSSFSMDVLIERTRVRAILKGAGGSLCKVYIHRRVDVKIGDTLISSGFIGGFPKGIPVGRVVKISYDLDEVSQVLTVNPEVETNTLEEVIIVKKTENFISDKILLSDEQSVSPATDKK
ncbi:MAG: rod shape-determining protein MreC [Zetaproteobacteria bacterium]|nr:rod shape-determining protein MreC [Pseudobdellovibrionaceae bacterium]